MRISKRKHTDKRASGFGPDTVLFTGVSTVVRIPGGVRLFGDESRLDRDPPFRYFIDLTDVEIADEYDKKKKEEEEPETPVIFRADRDGTITAVFPTLPASVGTPYTMTCYSHVGQHDSCSFPWYRSTKPAKDEKAIAELRAELESIGYRLKVYKAISSRLRYLYNQARAAL